MNREKLLQLKQKYRENPIIYNLIGVIIGECDRLGKDLTEEQIIIVMKKMYKNNIETLNSFTDNSIKSLSKSIEIQDENIFLKQYIPLQLGGDTIKELIEDFITINPNCNIGDIMKFFKTNYNGLYDGKLVSSIVKQLLNNN